MVENMMVCDDTCSLHLNRMKAVLYKMNIWVWLYIEKLPVRPNFEHEFVSIKIVY